MSNAQFKANFSRLLAAAGTKAEVVVRQSAVALQSGMVEKSAVDTGRFKGNWQAGIGMINTNTTSAEDKSGAGAISRTVSALESWKPGQTINLTNSLPYARRLEYGWSQQAPAGMVRLTVQNYNRTLAQIVARLKK